jgi:hypothetical protein
MFGLRTIVPEELRSIGRLRIINHPMTIHDRISFQHSKRENGLGRDTERAIFGDRKPGTAFRFCKTMPVIEPDVLGPRSSF